MKAKERKLLFQALEERAKWATRKEKLWERQWRRAFNAMDDEISAQELQAAEQMKYWEGVASGILMCMSLVTVWKPFEWRDDDGEGD